MRIAIGLGLLAVGLGGAFATFAMNQTPMQLGPVTFFVGCFLALVGLIVALT